MRPLAAAVWALLLLLTPAFSQTDPTSEQGLKPYGAYHGGDIDVVSMSNFKLDLHAPLTSFPQRGKLRMNFTIRYDDPEFELYTLCLINPNGSCTPNYYSTVYSGMGVQVVPDFQMQLNTTTVVTGLNAYSLQLADGSVHGLGLVPGSNFESLDATGWSYNSTSNVATDRDGVRYTLDQNYGTVPFIEDPNGNEIGLNSARTAYTDSMGRIIPRPPNKFSTGNTTDFSGCSGPLAIQWAYNWIVPAQNGGTETYKFCYALVQLNFNFWGITDSTHHADVSGDIMLQSIVLPNGTTWTFIYNDNYGNLTEIILPTGGTISYTSAIVRLCNQQSTLPRIYFAQVNSRTVNAQDGMGPHQWTYTFGSEVVSGSTRTMTQTITDPLGNQNVYTMTGLGGTCSYYPTQEQKYQGSTGGRLLETTTTTYSYAPNPNDISNPGSVINVVPTSIVTQLDNGKSRRVTKSYDSGFTFADYQGVTHAGIYGNLMLQDDYDYSGSLLRQTSYTYTAFDFPTPYLSNNMLSLVDSIIVSGGSGPGSQTYYGYDESICGTGSSSCLYSSGITTNHVASPYGANRGNRTRIGRWLNTTNTRLNTITSWLDTGMPYQIKDPRGNTTTYTYSATYDGAYLTQTQLPDTNSPNLAHHITSATYDFNTGLKATSTDENGNPTSYTYDSLRRILTITPPSSGGQLTFTYTDTPGSVQVERKSQIDAGGSADEIVLFDGFGRELSSMGANGESVPYDKTDTCYDARGLRSFVSYPYQVDSLAAEHICSGPGDAYAYDALYRLTSVTHSDGSSRTTSYTGAATSVLEESNGSIRVQRVSQLDGLGRLLSVCEVNGTALIGNGGAPGACGQDIGATGFLTTYQVDSLDNVLTVSQSGLNNRSFVYDSLSRLLTASNPEAGTTSYTYDADGNTVQRVRPAPNQAGTTQLTTTMAYDTLNRLRTETYSDGSSPVTFDYDETAAMGVTLTNTIGRKSSEYTGPSSAMATGSIYSYDSLGRVVDNSQCTPQNCGISTFPVVYHYDLAGDMTTSTDGMGHTVSYTYNVYPRLTGVTSSLSDTSHPGTLVSGVKYNAFGSPVADSLGNGNSESFSYTSRGWPSAFQGGKATTNTGTAASASVTVAGSEQTYQYPGSPGTPETGSVSISGALKSKQQCIVDHGINICHPVYDSGTVTITVGGVANSTGYGYGDTPATVASRLVTAINGTASSPVTATLSTATVQLKSKVNSSTNYISLSASSVSTGGFSPPSFSASCSGAALNPGTNPTPPGPVQYDAGTVTLTVNSEPFTVNYGQGSTGSSIAQALATMVTNTSGYVTAMASGATVVLTSEVVGAIGDYGFSGTSATTQSPTFTAPSFSFTPTSGSLSGGSGGTTIAPVYSYSVGYAPNGNVTSANDSASGNWTYSYDALNRLSAASQSGQAFSYVYDRFGNRWQQNLTAGSGPSPQYSFDANNHITTSGIAYDAAGNVTSDGAHTYIYDAENRISKVDNGSTATYVYDATGARIRKTAAAGTVDYIVDLSGRVVSEVTTAGAWNRGEVYASRWHVATYSGGNAGTTYFSYRDWLGSERVRTDAGATTVETCANLAFGDGLSCTGSDPSPLHFTGKQRDPETGLDDFPARYYSSTQGRWLTPDWSAGEIAVPYADLHNPQTLNLYAYVENSPISHLDLDGHICINLGDGCGGQMPKADDTTAEQAAQNQSVPAEVKSAIADSVKASNSPTADDKKGGYHEEGGIWGTTTSNGTVVVPAKPGPYSGPNDKTAHIDPGNSANPSLKGNLQSVDGTWHVHPRGGSDKTFVQPPSGVDKQNAVAPINIVVGAENKRVYFYNSTGVVREMSLKDFMKDSQ